MLEEWEDGMHWWLEECDSLQAFTLFADSDSVYGSIAGHLITNISDDYPRVPVTVVGCSPPRPKRLEDEKMLRVKASDEVGTRSQYPMMPLDEIHQTMTRCRGSRRRSSRGSAQNAP